VVIAGSEGRVYLLNRSNGLLENKITLQGKIKSEPVIDSKSLLIADLDGFIYNFNLRSAKLNWKLMHNTGVTAPVAVINNGFIVCDQNGGITLYRNAVKK
jgi:outer membrane protein assembly factor BamB